eukprot:TRINITY_DN8644_c0_g1_i2.p1 TRINITY_DN8644_c0_g1~~TRINITY_DN8644_c0_g1_i2.p1  ORF type:complete len:247 (-),score=31.56 TRINITY_DN8644_c0_g1_i2:31-771(-)
MRGLNAEWLSQGMRGLQVEKRRVSLEHAINIYEVVSTYQLSDEVIWLGVNILDRYLSHAQATRASFQLVGLACLVIATQHLVHASLPTLSEWVEMTANTYVVEELVTCIHNISYTLNHDLFAQHTPIHFLRRYSCIARPNARRFMTSRLILDLSMMVYKMIKYPAPILAAAAIYLARRIVKQAPFWPLSYQKISSLSEDDIISCARDMNQLIAELIHMAEDSPVKERYERIAYEEVAGFSYDSHFD